MSAEKELNLDSPPSLEKGEIHLVKSLDSAKEAEVEDYTQEGHFHRSISPRQLHVISLGSNIGSGLFVGSGAALAAGGPGNVVIAYTLVCGAVWGVMQTLAEMTIAFPVSGNYIDFADRWVDPALAFGAGLAEWLGWTAIVGSETAFFHIYVSYWSGDSFPKAASITIFLAFCFVIFTMPNKVFAWFEFFASLIKVFTFILLLVLSLAIVCGAGPKGFVHDGEFWRTLPVFKNGFSGFGNAALLATWAVGDQIFIGVMGGEARNPRLSMARAANLVPPRVSFFYIACIVFITLLVPSNDDRLLGGSGAASSPFIIAIEDVGIPVVPSIVNAGIMCGILAIAAESIYLSSRVLRTMAYQGLINRWVAHVDEKGRPVRSLLITCALAVVLSYMNLNGGGIVALNWLIQITASSYFLNWIIVAFTSWRFHQAVKAQNDPLFNQLYAWNAKVWPLPTAWLMLISFLLLICCFAVGIQAPGDQVNNFTAGNFFEYTLGVWVIMGLTVLYKVIFRTKWRSPKHADLQTGRNVLSEEDIAELNKYFAKPSWRRFLSYLKLW